MNEPATALCQTITDRLLEGQKLTGQPELIAHVGSCLDCFRTLTELRELPRISEALRSDAATASFGEDPGPAFWKAMPGLIADQILEARRTSARPSAASRTAHRWWAPAALMATGVAAALFALVLVYRPAATEIGGAGNAGADGTSGAVASKTMAVLGDEDLRALAEASADDDSEGALEQLASLDSAELQRLTEALGQELQ